MTSAARARPRTSTRTKKKTMARAATVRTTRLSWTPPSFQAMVRDGSKKWRGLYCICNTITTSTRSMPSAWMARSRSSNWGGSKRVWSIRSSLRRSRWTIAFVAARTPICRRSMRWNRGRGNDTSSLGGTRPTFCRRSIFMDSPSRIPLRRSRTRRRVRVCWRCTEGQLKSTYCGRWIIKVEEAAYWRAAIQSPNYMKSGSRLKMRATSKTLFIPTINPKRQLPIVIKG